MIKKMKVVNQILPVLLMLIFASCKPSLSDCEDCLVKKYNGAIRVSSISKKNGIGSQSNGYTTHEIYFSCTIEFIQDYKLKAGYGTLTEYKKGDKFEIENAHAQFVKTDNGWLCNGADYDMLYGYNYIDASGNRVSANEYEKRKAEEKAREPRCFTGSIYNYIPYAALKIQINSPQITAVIYDKEKGDLISCNGYISGKKWVLKLNSGSWLEGEYWSDSFEGSYIQDGTKVSNFSFREVSFDWERTKAYDVPAKRSGEVYQKYEDINTDSLDTEYH